MSGNHHHGPGCPCHACEHFREFERADDRRDEVVAALTSALESLKPDAKCVEIIGEMKIDRHDECLTDYDVRFTVPDMPALPKREQLEGLARVLHALADAVYAAARPTNKQQALVASGVGDAAGS